VRWWVALAENRAVAGDRAAALAAWRRALSGAGSDVQAEDLRLALAREALAAGLPDTALAVVAPLAAAWRLEIRLEAMLLSGRAFAAMGQLDSALVRWDRVADDHPNSIEAAAEARYLRGTGLESANRWEEARTEFRALGASYPAHRLAIRAMGRIVEYHARRGQTELARIEGLRAITALDRLILRQRDLDVQFEARLERARLLERIGSATEAFDALLAFWRRYPRSYDGQEAGMRAAANADSALDDQALAADLYREMEARPVRTVVRDRVRAGLEALGVKE